MHQTLKAILARSNGDVAKAQQYCLGVARTATNMALKQEYYQLANYFDAEKAKAAHV